MPHAIPHGYKHMPGRGAEVSDLWANLMEFMGTDRERGF